MRCRRKTKEGKMEEQLDKERTKGEKQEELKRTTKREGKETKEVRIESVGGDGRGRRVSRRGETGGRVRGE